MAAYGPLSIAAGGGHSGIQTPRRGLVQNTEPQVVESEAGVTIMSAPDSESFETRAPVCASISKIVSPEVKRYLLLPET